MRQVRFAVTLLAMPFIAACIVLPVPTPDHAAEPGYIKNDRVDSLVQGWTTRADVLLSLGGPHHRLESDRVFIYEYTAHQAYIFWGVGAHGGGDGGVVPVRDPHLLCIEFDGAGVVRRIRQIEANWFGWKEIRRELWRWTQAGSCDAPGEGQESR